MYSIEDSTIIHLLGTCHPAFTTRLIRAAVEADDGHSTARLEPAKSSLGASG